MPPRAQLPPHPSAFALLMWDAMHHRTAATGVTYTYVDLARDMGELTGRPRSIAHMRNIVAGLKWPSPALVADIARALRLDPDQALLTAGWAPRAVQALNDAMLSGQTFASDELIAGLDGLVQVVHQARETYRRLLSMALPAQAQPVGPSPPAPPSADDD